MKIADLQGRLFTPGVMADIPTGRLVWVDQVHGNDALAVRERLTVPFKTLTAAKNAAQSGDTIMVLPGTYAEWNLLRDQVNWFFLPGAVVNYSGSGGIFDTSGATVNAVVAGHGEFIQSGSGLVVNLPSPSTSSKVAVQARRMQADGGGCIGVHGTSCNVQVDVLGDITGGSVNAWAILVSGSGSRTTVRADRIETTSLGAYTVNVSAGSLEVAAHRISSNGGVVSILGGTGEVVIRAYELYSSNWWVVRYGATNYFPTLAIVGARLKSMASGSAGWPVRIESNVGSAIVLRLAACLLLPSSGTSVSISAAYPNTQVQLSAPCTAQKDKDTNTVIIPNLGVYTSAWMVNPNFA